MKTIEMINKETNEPMTTKDGTAMFKHTLEAGDLFVCLWNRPIEEKKGNAVHPRYYIKVNILVDGQEVEQFIDLTPTQFKSLCNVADDKESDDLNQYKFKCYAYTDSMGGTSIGVTHKEKKEAVSLVD
jgi:hypothetical protein